MFGNFSWGVMVTSPKIIINLPKTWEATRFIDKRSFDTDRERSYFFIIMIFLPVNREMREKIHYYPEYPFSLVSPALEYVGAEDPCQMTGQHYQPSKITNPLKPRTRMWAVWRKRSLQRLHRKHDVTGIFVDYLIALKFKNTLSIQNRP